MCIYAGQVEVKLLWEKKLELATVIGQDFEGNLESMILGMIE
jgi:hypothetical protein